MFYRYSILVFFVFLVIPAVFLLINCGEETPQAPVPPVETDDVTPPAAVTGLYTRNTTSGAVPLVWNAPGDDGMVPGTAARYDIRHSTLPITGANFVDATRVQNEPDPSPMGQQDSCLVFIPDPEPDEHYYFAMRVADEVPNWSPLSRIVKAMKIDQVLVVFPDSITIGRDEDVQVMFRSVNAKHLYKLSVLRWVWDEYPQDKYRVVKHFTPARYPVGVYSFLWDLKDDDNHLIPLSYAWVWVRLYRGVTPIDSVKIRLHDK